MIVNYLSMRYLIYTLLILFPAVALADPGHGAPVLHTHAREIAIWIVLIIGVIYGVRKAMVNK